MSKENYQNKVKFMSKKKLSHNVEGGYLSTVKILLIIVPVTIVFVALVAVYYQRNIDNERVLNELSNSSDNESLSNNDNLSSHARLISVNSDYKAAEEFRAKGNHVEALKFYEKAKAQSSSSDLGQIEFKFGTSLIASGDIVGGISHLKGVASDNNFNKFVRAYAVYDIASVYCSGFNPDLKDEIFNDETYKPLYVEGDLRASCANLFKYSVYIQSTAQAELRIARYLAEDLLVRDPADLVEKSDVVNEITERIDSANIDLSRIVSHDKNSADLTYFLLGQVTSMLHRAGVTVSVTPESAFENALVYAKERNDSLNYLPPISYAYAIHLAAISADENREKIRELMRDVYNYPNFNKSSLYKKLQQQKDDFSSLDYKNALLISQIDPQFKNFLIGLGWSI
jgi:hypothetical protein